VLRHDRRLTGLSVPLFPKPLQEALPKTEPELGQADGVWVIGEGEAALVRNAVVFAVDVKTVQRHRA
jgi:hypothetical protein